MSESIHRLITDYKCVGVGVWEFEFGIYFVVFVVFVVLGFITKYDLQ